MSIRSHQSKEGNWNNPYSAGGELVEILKQNTGRGAGISWCLSLTLMPLTNFQ